MKTLTLPWFDPCLMYNKKVHYHMKAKSRKKQRADCRLIASQIKPEFEDGKISLEIIFYPPDRRARDIDGCLTAAKGLIDGVADAWGVNDRRFRPITIDDGEVVKGGKIVLTASQDV